jgi:hypothetical protein
LLLDQVSQPFPNAGGQARLSNRFGQAGVENES